MQMDVGLDTGDMLHKVTTPIEPNETSASLYAKLAELAPPALLEVLNGLESHAFKAEKQNESQSNYAENYQKKRQNWIGNSLLFNWNAISEPLTLGRLVF
ncbi:Methionyl-tRNA formyltransferase [Mannheimia haemolytica]|nr:Methionyl-tRNA formyltransferase [Mannheimia haemolytica]